MNAALRVNGKDEEQDACEHGDDFFGQGFERCCTANFQTAQKWSKDPQQSGSGKDGKDDFFPSAHGPEFFQFIANPLAAAGNPIHLDREKHVEQQEGCGEKQKRHRKSNLHPVKE